MNAQDAFATFPPGFPRPNWDQPTMDRVVARRAALQAGCPRHPGKKLRYYKELFVSDTDGVHLPTMAVYADGCLAKVRLDVEADEITYEKAPDGTY